jgi:hypothetical protein
MHASLIDGSSDGGFDSKASCFDIDGSSDGGF